MASVKVAVRVRPFNERELSLDSKCIVRMDGNKTIIMNQKATEMIDSGLTKVSTNDLTNPTSSNGLSNQTNSSFLIASTTSSNQINNSNSTNLNQNQNNTREKYKEFIYDASYWSFDSNDSHYVSQADVYKDLGKSTVDNAFDGYNACVCAYGQTGSGKSYSMMGVTSSLDHEGLTPRICKALFERIHANFKSNGSNSSNTNQNVTYRTEVSYLEIYNEKVRDLLRTSHKMQQNLKVREHPKTGVYVQDLSQHIVVNYYDIEELINRGNINRTTASTNMNDVSSRSHAIFTIRFSQAKIVENIPSETISKVNLVDLAGSERADSTGATGIRLKEGGNINKSLLTFINVISTLADLSSNSSEQQRKHYIPYRDSVLTWLLKDSLGGNSKTVILAAISPADVNYVETLSTLRYANRAKNIINKPTINEDPNVKLIRELRAEIVRLKVLLESSSITSNLNNEMKFKDLVDPKQQDLNKQIEKSELNEKNLSLLEQINANQTKIDVLTNKWKSKWQKYHSIFDENESLSLEKNKTGGICLFTNSQPYLISIEEEPQQFANQHKQLNSFCIYPLKHGKTLIGSSSNANNNDYQQLDDEFSDSSHSEQNDIIIYGSNVNSLQCYLTRNENLVYLHPVNGYCQLNYRLLLDGKELLNSSDLEQPQQQQSQNDLENDYLNGKNNYGIELKHGDLILLGEKNLFMFNNPLSLNEKNDSDENGKRLNLSSLIRNLTTQISNGNGGDGNESKTNSLEFIEDSHNKQIELLNNKLTKYEAMIDEQRTQIQQMHEQIELNNIEMNKLKELSLKPTVNTNRIETSTSTLDISNEQFRETCDEPSQTDDFVFSQKEHSQNQLENEDLNTSKNVIKNESKSSYGNEIINNEESGSTCDTIGLIDSSDSKSDRSGSKSVLDEKELMQNLVEKFERDEKLLSECMKDLNKVQQRQLKSLIFELQNLRLKDYELESEFKRNRIELEKSVDKLNEKRDKKLSELNRMREEILKNQKMIDLKLKMSNLNNIEMDLDVKINEFKSDLSEELDDLNRLNTELNIKKIYSISDNQSLNDLIEAENETIQRAREQLEEVKKQKQNSYLIIENEFEIARELMIEELESTNQDLTKLKQVAADLIEKESKLKKFLNDCLYENDEEKCLVENELTELVESRESLEEQIEDIRSKNRSKIDEQMIQEYKGLADLKQQDLEEIKQDEDRINLLYESSIKNIQDCIQLKKANIVNKQNDLKCLQATADMHNKQMNELLAELEVLENRRLIDENRIFHSELQLANEFKIEFDKFTSQLNKLDAVYHKKLGENQNEKNNLKPKLCNLVGPYRGIQLFEADFNPKLPQQNNDIGLNTISYYVDHETSSSSSISMGRQRQMSTLFIDTNLAHSSQLNVLNQTNSDSGNVSSISAANSSASSSGSSPVNNDLVRTIRKEQQSQIKFQTCISKMLGISIEINESMQFGKKLIDEHFEYLIELRVNEDNWIIFRRYSKLRSLHEKMCVLYPSLNRVVFPMRFLFGNSEKQLIDRQFQLEHYLRCFFEILINDPTCPIYYLGVQSSPSLANLAISTTPTLITNSVSMNSISSSSSFSYSSQTTAYSSAACSPLNTISLNKVKICSFCPFFEQTETDRNYLNRLILAKSSNFQVYYKNFLSNNNLES